MDKRSWLWRRKSSEKSPSGETESSRSLSSHSERFSDDQILSIHNVQSPQLISKADDTVKTLSEKLSEALLNIRAKEDLVKQHAKVAEEAVSGWERAENEVLALKEQNDALTQKNTSLNVRVDHLDGALKECLRELRQARDEQQEKIHDAIAKKNREWESQLENQFAKTDTNNADILSKLEALEKEKSILKLKLVSKAQELEVTTKERDLSTRAAETASKQHLDSIKRVAKLEAECRRLKATARNRKATIIGNHESLTEDSQSENEENGERMLVSGKQGKSLFCPWVEIELMDDFVEMERSLAAIAIPIPDEKTSKVENALRNEHEVEETLKKISAEKVSLEIGLKECRIQLNTSQVGLNHMKMQLAMAEEEVECMKVKLKKSTTKLQDGKRRVEAQLEDAKLKKDEAESRLQVREHELERQVGKEKGLSREAVAKCNMLEAEISRMKSEKDSQFHFQRSAIVEEFRINQEKELGVAAVASKFAECQKTIASLDRQLKSLAAFEDFSEIDTITIHTAY